MNKREEKCWLKENSREKLLPKENLREFSKVNIIQVWNWFKLIDGEIVKNTFYGMMREIEKIKQN